MPVMGDSYKYWNVVYDVPAGSDMSMPEMTCSEDLQRIFPQEICSRCSGEDSVIFPANHLLKLTLTEFQKWNDTEAGRDSVGEDDMDSYLYESGC